MHARQPQLRMRRRAAQAQKPLAAARAPMPARGRVRRMSESGTGGFEGGGCDWTARSTADDHSEDRAGDGGMKRIRDKHGPGWLVWTRRRVHGPSLRRLASGKAAAHAIVRMRVGWAVPGARPTHDHCGRPRRPPRPRTAARDRRRAAGRRRHCTRPLTAATSASAGAHQRYATRRSGTSRTRRGAARRGAVGRTWTT